MLRMNVVSANAPSPSGPGSAVIGRTRGTPAVGSVLARAASPLTGSLPAAPASIGYLPREDNRSGARLLSLQQARISPPEGADGRLSRNLPSVRRELHGRVRRLTRRRPPGSSRRPALHPSRWRQRPARRRGGAARGSALSGSARRLP